MTTNNVIDFTREALKRRAARYLNQGDTEAFECIEALIEGYDEGLWTIYWENGEPMFKALIPSELSVSDYYPSTWAFESNYDYGLTGYTDD